MILIQSLPSQDRMDQHGKSHQPDHDDSNEAKQGRLALFDGIDAGEMRIEVGKGLVYTR